MTSSDTPQPSSSTSQSCSTGQAETDESQTLAPVPTRRRFLAGLGGAALVPAVGLGCDARSGFVRDEPSNGDDRRGKDRGGRRRERRGDRPDAPLDGIAQPRADEGFGRFVRMFEGPAFAEPSERLTEALVEVGRPGGIMDAKDPLEVGPVRLITEPELSPGNPDNATHTAGSTFMGQFLDHDITSDAGSTLGVPKPATSSQNLRSARFDLDSVYGGGPTVSPHLYIDGEEGTFKVESGGVFEDLPRADNGTAIVAESRNDENLIISGLQVAFLKFHNAVLAEEASSVAPLERFEQARQVVRWHYQWLIMHQFLPQYVGQAMVDDVVANGRQWFTTDLGRIPLEFQTAAYRFGHSMIRPSYRANLAGDNGEPFFALVFDPTQMGQPDPNDLSGRSRAPRRFVGWQTFFDFGDGEVKPNKRVDTAISTPMFNLPTSTVSAPSGEPLGPLSLPTRNLLRHTTWELPSGQYLARETGSEPLAAADLTDIGDIDPTLAEDTPLWFYLLREAEVFADGLHLGPIGGRIVAEVFIGLLQNDPTSYFHQEDWRPTLPSRTGEFRMADLLTIAGVDPTSRGQ